MGRGFLKTAMLFEGAVGALNDENLTPKTCFDMWKILLEGLDAEEPLVRLLALRSLDLAFHSYIFLESKEIKIKLIESLLNLLSSEDGSIARNHVTHLVGKCAMFTDLPFAYQKLAFDVIYDLFCSIFSRTDAPETCNGSDLLVILSISKFFSLKEAISPSRMKNLDGILTNILKESGNYLLIATILNVLSLELPKTNRNRIRIENIYKPSLITVNQKVAEYVSSSHSKRKNASFLVLKKSLHQFWSIWFPYPSDSAIISDLKIDVQTDNEGLYARRMQYVKSKLNTDSLSLQVDQILNEITTEITKTPSEGILYDIIIPARTLIFPFPVEGNTSFSLKIEMSGLRFTNSTKKISFYVQNDSNIMATSFFLQVSHPYAFQVIPSFGSLAPSEAIMVDLFFTPTNRYQDSVISGFLRTRTSNGKSVFR